MAEAERTSMLENIIKEANQKMDKSVESLERDLATLRTGRASAEVLNGVMVEAYGAQSPINQVATVNTPDAASIIIQPWDPSIVAAIEKAILSANIGLTPSNDGKIIRLNIPPLTEESRKEIVKKAHEMAEAGRVGIRNIRRHMNDEIKKAEKAHDISEDEGKRLHDQVQKTTDGHVKTIDSLLAAKEKEIMHV